MINIEIFILLGIILLLVVFVLFQQQRIQKEQKKSEILSERLEIKKLIEIGHRPDRIFWKHHNVTRLDGLYNIKLKGFSGCIQKLKENK